MNARASWFEVDRRGLAAIAARRNKRFILRELIQNSWDENSTEVRVEIDRSTIRGRAIIEVRDDSPEGFADLTHAYTLFAPSKKVVDPTKRGRFNFGEKLVLALCHSASITTTTGRILFENGERRRRSPAKTEKGSIFHGEIKMTADEVDALVADARRMIPPPDKETWVNGEKLAHREPIRVARDIAMLTEIAGDDGTLKSQYRCADIRVFEVPEGEVACLFEMGIPVVETEDRFHVDVTQKVPLNMERDNVSPSYLRDVRVAVANVTHDLLDSEDANSSWARDALADGMCSAETASTLTKLRFGDRAVIFDPSDPEANSLAVAKGYTVVHGSQLNADEWDRIREHRTLLPAGQVTPSPKPFTENGRPLKMVTTVTPEMRRFATLVDALGEVLCDRAFNLSFADDRGWDFEGCIDQAGRLIINVARFPEGFDDPAAPRLLEWTIHELAHTVEKNHLDDRYHDTLCKFGAKVARLALDQPEVFR